MSLYQSENLGKKVDAIINAIRRKEHVVIQGLAGCGKTYIARIVVKKLRAFGYNVSCTALTGIAALNFSQGDADVEASTLHRWAGCGLAQKSPEYLASHVHAAAKKNWKQTNVLLIDEFSMFGKNLFEKLDKMGRIICDTPGTPWGGVLFIFIGDMMQLKPVKDDWIFKSKVYQSLNLYPVSMNIPYRYSDISYYDMLLRARIGKLNATDIRRLKACNTKYHAYQASIEKDPDMKIIRPTVIYPKRISVRIYNDTEMAKLTGEPVMYRFTDEYHPEPGVRQPAGIQDKLKALIDQQIPTMMIELKPGAQVMSTINYGIEPVVNGSRGVVMKLMEDKCLVQFIHRQMIVEYVPFTIESKYGVYVRTAMPLIIAYATTIHKIQGLTIDYAQLDAGGNIFESGQSYVGLSRVRSYEGLFLSQFNPKSVFADQDAIRYTDYLKELEYDRMEPDVIYKSPNGYPDDVKSCMRISIEQAEDAPPSELVRIFTFTTRLDYLKWVRQWHPDKLDREKYASYLPEIEMILKIVISKLSTYTW